MVPVGIIRISGGMFESGCDVTLFMYSWPVIPVICWFSCTRFDLSVVEMLRFWLRVQARRDFRTPVPLKSTWRSWMPSSDMTSLRVTVCDLS